MYKDIYSSDLWYLEIHNDRATKQNGTIYLREVCGFDRVVGFGDNLNDLPLYAACDVRVAVENAKDEVKNAADFICDTNENDGVVKWIEGRIK
jgi:hydroxymethylpyrimidine pyrophosphatase-like HAD family hydrolase